MAGLASLLGASTVDGLYCSVAGFGITYVAEFLKEHQVIFQLAGGLVLVVVGIAIIRSRPTEVVSRNDREGFFGNYTSAFFLTLMNPMSIIVFTAAFTGLGVHGWKGNYWSTAVLVLGVLSGSVVWAPFLVTATSLFGSKFDRIQPRVVNKLSGFVITGFGLFLGIMTLLERRL